MTAPVAEMSPHRLAKQAKRGRLRLLTLEDVDVRTRQARNCKQIQDDIRSDLGGVDGLSTLERLGTSHAAVVAAMIQDVSARWLNGQEVDPATVTQLTNCFNRTAKSLGWHRRAKDVSTGLVRRLAELDGEPNAS